VSTFEPAVVRCPSCGTEQSTSVATSLHGPRVPEHVDAILAGTFQRLTCGGCATAFVVDRALLYLDFTNYHWVMMYPPEWRPRWREACDETVAAWRRNTVDNAPLVVRMMNDRMQVRTVFGLRGLREKLLAWRHGLDDALIEVVKLDLLASEPDLMDAPGVELDLLEITPDTLSFAALGPAPGRLDVDRAVVRALATDPEWAPILTAIRRKAWVDARRLFEDGEAP
jgi:hypothetical protein